MDEVELQEVRKNKAIRGYILRSLVKGYNNSMLVKQLTNIMVTEGIVLTPDLCKHLDYLVSGGYIEFTDRRVSAYTAYKRDAIIKLTKAGVDLVEGTVEDAGVDI